MARAKTTGGASRGKVYDGEIIPPGTRSRRESFERLDKLATMLDSAIAIPGTNIRVGADALIGLFPGIGDTITTGLAGYIVYKAWRMGIPKHMLVRMIGNVAVDGVIGAVPVAGDVFDVLWRANRRNMKLLRSHLQREGHL